jgi:alkylation response protein AidB-like acyl-CoA dehydrogenase
MRFEIAVDDAALAGVVTDVLTAECTSGLVRAGWSGGRSAEVCAVWSKLADIGVVGTLVAEESGGIGLSENALVPLLEAFGRSALPVPVAETIAVAAPLLAAAGGDAKTSLLSGESWASVSLDGSDLVPFGGQADLIVLRLEDELRLFTRAELSLDPVRSVDGSRDLARVIGRNAEGVLLTDDPGRIEESWQRGVLATSALLVGLSERMLEMTVDYVKQREQFGVAVGTFQAVKHALADAALAVRFAQPAVLAAGWALAAGAPQARVDTAMAKILSSDAARLVAKTAIQCHGAIAYTTEYDLHLYAKRAWALASCWGDPALHRDRLAELLDLRSQR